MKLSAYSRRIQRRIAHGIIKGGVGWTEKKIALLVQVGLSGVLVAYVYSGSLVNMAVSMAVMIMLRGMN
jgi:uncharacterized protein related to proFAR isomerase